MPDQPCPMSPRRTPRTDACGPAEAEARMEQARAFSMWRSSSATTTTSWPPRTSRRRLPCWRDRGVGPGLLRGAGSAIAQPAPSASARPPAKGHGRRCADGARSRAAAVPQGPCARRAAACEQSARCRRAPPGETRLRGSGRPHRAKLTRAVPDLHRSVVTSTPKVPRPRTGAARSGAGGGRYAPVRAADGVLAADGGPPGARLRRLLGPRPGAGRPRRSHGPRSPRCR